jgi:hypothetical protein
VFFLIGPLHHDATALTAHSSPVKGHSHDQHRAAPLISYHFKFACQGLRWHRPIADCTSGFETYRIASLLEHQFCHRIHLLFRQHELPTSAARLSASHRSEEKASPSYGTCVCRRQAETFAFEARLRGCPGRLQTMVVQLCPLLPGPILAKSILWTKNATLEAQLATCRTQNATKTR